MFPKADIVKEKYTTYIGKHENEWGGIPGDSLALCIGAGVTREYVGDWGELLNELAIMRVNDTLVRQWGALDDEINIGKLKEYLLDEKGFFPKETNVLEQGQYLMDDDRDASYPILYQQEQEVEWREIFFAAQVLQAVDNCINKKLDGSELGKHYINYIDDVKNKFLSKHAKIDNCVNRDLGTLHAVLHICINGNVEKIINYNFDTILERLLCDDAVCEKVAPGSAAILPSINVYSYSNEPISKLSKRRKSGRTINIYHVHGIAYTDPEHPIQPLIFSEHSYLEYQNALMNWSHLRIAEVLSTDNLLCVGFSGADANFRYLSRILYQLQKKPYLIGTGKKHKVWLNFTYKSFKASFMDGSKNGDYRAFACFETFTDSVTNYFRNEYGVSVLWSESYDDMAEKLCGITG